MSNSLWSRTFTNIKRSGWRSYAIIFMMVITFVALGMLLTVIFTSHNVVKFLVQKPEVIGFFKDEVDEAQILQIKRELEAEEFVHEIRYISKEEAMRSFLEDNRDREDITASVTSNPFPAHLNIKADSLGEVPMVVEALKSRSAAIDEVHDPRESLDVLSKVVFGIQVISIVLLVIFSISTMLVMTLAIGMTIYAHKSEIIIMKLVGANNWYVQAPYIMQSFIMAFASVAISSLIWGAVLFFKYNDVMKLVSRDDSIFRMSPEVILSGMLVQFIFAGFLAFVSSYFATRRYIDY